MNLAAKNIPYYTVAVALAGYSLALVLQVATQYAAV